MPKVRTTITIDADLLEQWQKIARLQRSSLSAVINDWLLDTSEAAMYAAVQVAATSQGTRDRVSELVTGLKVLQEGYELIVPGKAGVAGTRAARAAPAPPSCNTGGKFNKGQGGRRAA